MNNGRLQKMSTPSYSEIEGKARAKNIPLYAHVDLTYRCNLTCTHCYMATDSLAKELSTGECKNMLEQLAELGTLYLALSGGEILVRRDFFEVAEHARKLGFVLRLFTNGALITAEIAQKIAALQPLVVEISVYGGIKHTHDAITGSPGSLERTMRGVKLLREKGLRILLKTPIMASTLGQVQSVEDIAGEVGALFRTDSVIMPKTDGSKGPLDLRIDDDDLNTVFSEINRDWRLHNPDCNATICNAGKSVMTISPYGDVFACLRIRNSAGNLRTRSLAKIWRDSEVLHGLREMTLSKLTTCSTCRDIEFCSPCPGLALLEHGDLHEPAQECCRQADARKRASEQGFLQLL